MSKQRSTMAFKSLVSGSYQTITLTGTYLQLLKGAKGWTVSSSTITEGPFETFKTAKMIAQTWDRAREIERISETFKLEDHTPIQGKYLLTLADVEGVMIEQVELGGGGYPLPLHMMGLSSLASEINDRLRLHEKNNPPADEVPI